jgi:hypothetical protein
MFKVCLPQFAQTLRKISLDLGFRGRCSIRNVGILFVISFQHTELMRIRFRTDLLWEMR